MIVTIDGPAGTGKTTVAKKVALRMGLPFFDTGAMYRAVTLFFLQKGIQGSNQQAVDSFMLKFTFEIDRQGRYIACGIDVTDEIRSSEVTQNVSAVSALPSVREAIWAIQRRFAKKRGGVFEGRDMGTVVFPKAKIKIFLTAKSHIRAKRRFQEMANKKSIEEGLLSQETVLKDIERRDQFDSQRELAPLIVPQDAYVIDTSELSIDDVVEKILDYRQKKRTTPIWMHPRGITLFYRFVLCVTWIVTKVFYRHRVYGLQRFYPEGALIAANHASFLDPPLVAISWPQRVHFLARQSLFRHRILGRAIRALNTHPVKASVSDLSVFKMICHLLEEGEKVVLFPEGRRSETGQLGLIKPGIGMFISKTKTAIIPTYLKGTFEIWSRDRKFPKLWGKTACVFGSPILWQEFEHLDKKEAQEAVAKRLTSAIENLKKWLEDGAKGIPP